MTGECEHDTAELAVEELRKRVAMDLPAWAIVSLNKARRETRKYRLKLAAVEAQLAEAQEAERELIALVAETAEHQATIESMRNEHDND